MRITIPPPGENAVLDGVSWTELLAILDELGESRGSRITYDQGHFEVMSPSRRHERVGSLLGRFVEILTDELDIEIQAIKATTLLREDLAKGAESDECFYVQNQSRVPGFSDLDLTRDPPPDLVIEVDITQRCLDRLPIYAALGVPELWRYHERQLHVLILEDGEYRRVKDSPTFPRFPVAEFLRFVELGHELSDTAVRRRFREWVRERIAG